LLLRLPGAVLGGVQFLLGLGGFLADLRQARLPCGGFFAERVPLLLPLAGLRPESAEQFPGLPEQFLAPPLEPLPGPPRPRPPGRLFRRAAASVRRGFPEALAAERRGTAPGVAPAPAAPAGAPRAGPGSRGAPPDFGGRSLAADGRSERVGSASPRR